MALQRLLSMEQGRLRGILSTAIKPCREVQRDGAWLSAAVTQLGVQERPLRAARGAPTWRHPAEVALRPCHVPLAVHHVTLVRRSAAAICRYRESFALPSPLPSRLPYDRKCVTIRWPEVAVGLAGGRATAGDGAGPR